MATDNTSDLPAYTAAVRDGCHNKALDEDTAPTYPSSELPSYAELYPTQPETAATTSSRRQSTCTAVLFVAPSGNPANNRRAPHMPYCGLIVFALVVLMFCNFLFGLIALYLAVTAELSENVDKKVARKYGWASCSSSIVGILVTLLVISFAVRSRDSSQSSSSSTTVYSNASVGSVRLTSTLSMTSSSPSGRYVSPDTCCSARGYVYPGNGSNCYGDVYPAFKADDANPSSACPYFYISSRRVCFLNSYVLSSKLCCRLDNEPYYSLLTHRCYK